VIEDPPTAQAIIRLTDMYAQNVNAAIATPRRAQPAKLLSFVAKQTGGRPNDEAEA
jgi:hypothetical protein